MTDVTNILSQIEDGDPSATEKLLPLVYEELRKLAAARMAVECSDHTLQATALVHEAYLRLVDVEQVQHWDSRGHFFSAAAEAMRRILVDQARKKRSLKRGGEQVQQVLNIEDFMAPQMKQDILILDEALELLAQTDPQVAELVKLRYFVGLSNKESAALLGLSPRTADNYWAYAKSWLLQKIESLS